jgi:hypothetical protein
VRDVVGVRGTLDVKLKDVNAPLSIYDVQAIGDVRLPERTDEPLRPLDPALRCVCYRIEGKRMSETPLEGRLIVASSTVGQVWLPETVAMREPLRIVLHGVDGVAPPDVYAKVSGVESGGSGARVLLVFTSMLPEVKPLLAVSRTIGSESG